MSAWAWLAAIVVSGLAGVLAGYFVTRGPVRGGGAARTFHSALSVPPPTDIQDRINRMFDDVRAAERGVIPQRWTAGLDPDDRVVGFDGSRDGEVVVTRQVDGFVRVAWVPHLDPPAGEECWCPICIARKLDILDTATGGSRSQTTSDTEE